ncbi:MAG TPA: SCO family protein, partial [Alphaproteobacteria bacterium]|nr:SCO family protein [Alphaproteobacteria bacterium]
AHMTDRVRFVSITVDPERDTPAVRKAYAKPHGLDPSNWMFLAAPTGTEARALAAKAGLKVVPEKDGEFDHPVVTYVIDDAGKLRARFFGLKFDPLNVVMYINGLVNDPHYHHHATDRATRLPRRRCGRGSRRFCRYPPCVVPETSSSPSRSAASPSAS